MGDEGDSTLLDILTFNVNAGDLFGVYGILLRANAKGGIADATQTLRLDFEDDIFITAVARPSPIPTPAAVWLLGAGMIGLLGFRHKKNE